MTEHIKGIAGAALSLALLSVPAVSPGASVLYNVAGYTSFADSPFSQDTPATFYLEDFEDGLFDTPGVTGVSNTPGTALGVLAREFGNSYVDSVDADDGVIDGSGLAGHSLGNLYNTASEDLGYTFTFDATVLGGLPTHVGIVWTDGGYGQSTVFEAYDASGVLVGQVGPVQTGDYSFSGTTAEDRFLGIFYDAGIASFTIRDPGGYNNLEVDHLQYGLTAVPVPAALWLFAGGLVTLVSAGRGVRMGTRPGQAGGQDGQPGEGCRSLPASLSRANPALSAR